jgi:hypothetical protein
MIDESLKTALLEKHGTLDFKALVAFMESTGINYQNRRMRGPMGLATYHTVYVDLAVINQYPDNLLYFIILHETAHYKRIERMGGKDVVIKMLSIEDFEEFCQHVIGEEIVADRYACFVYQILTKFRFPREATQNLHMKHIQDRYKEKSAVHLFGVVKNNEDVYHQLLESFLI